MPIYVEIEMPNDMERLWEYTQRPELHERWDLRFSSITYLPRNKGQPQRFLYCTRIGFGLKICGEGESLPEKNRKRRFDAYMIYSEQRGCIVDYLGTHQHLAVDLHLSVAENACDLASNAFTNAFLVSAFPCCFQGSRRYANRSTMNWESSELT